MVLRNTTFNLPDDLVARANAYASSHGTTVTAIIREHTDWVRALSCFQKLSRKHLIKIADSSRRPVDRGKLSARREPRPP